MKIVFRVILFVALLGAGLWLWIHFHPGPEEAIRKRLLALAQCASFGGNEGEIARMAASQELGDYFTQDATVTINIPELILRTFESRVEIVQAAYAAHKGLQSVHAEFVDMDIVLASDRKSAVAELTAKVTVPSEKSFFPQQLRFHLALLEGKWLIRQVDTVEVLR
jgi:hypothetical protein